MKTGNLQKDLNKKNYKPPIAFVRVLYKNKKAEAFSILESPSFGTRNFEESLASTFLREYKDSYSIEILDETLDKTYCKYRD